jgi:hypothetical protein
MEESRLHTAFRPIDLYSFVVCVTTPSLSTEEMFIVRGMKASSAICAHLKSIKKRINFKRSAVMDMMPCSLFKEGRHCGRICRLYVQD